MRDNSSFVSKRDIGIRNMPVGITETSFKVRFNKQPMKLKLVAFNGVKER